MNSILNNDGNNYFMRFGDEPATTWTKQNQGMTDESAQRLEAHRLATKAEADNDPRKTQEREFGVIESDIDELAMDMYHFYKTGGKVYNLIIAGGRDFSDYRKLCQRMVMIADWLPTKVDLTNQLRIISGGANGADKLGEQFAREMGLQLLVMPAQWDQYGKSAGYRRNTEMAQRADGLLAFWDGRSKGTRHMAQTAYDMGRHTAVVRY